MTLHSFPLMLRDIFIIHFCFCFVLFFLCRPPSKLRPISPARCFFSSLGVFLRTSSCLGSRRSTQKNITAHIRSYHTFCVPRALQPFPISVWSGILYIAYLVAQNRTYDTILNHPGSLTHAHQLAGYELTWSSDYRFQLLLRGAKRFLGQAVSRKSAITPSILHAASALFNFSIPLQATMWALFLVAFFTFSR